MERHAGDGWRLGDFLPPGNLYSVLSPWMLRSDDYRYMYSLRYTFSIERVLGIVPIRASQPRLFVRLYLYRTRLLLLITGRTFFYLLDQLEASPRPFAFPSCLPISIAFVDQHASS